MMESTAAGKADCSNSGSSGSKTDCKVLRGEPASPGIASGLICFARRGIRKPLRTEAGSAEDEENRFMRACAHADTQLKDLHDQYRLRLGEENATVFEVHRMMLADPQFVGAVVRYLRQERCNAEYAVHQAADTLQRRFLDGDSEVLQARAADISDIAGRVIDILSRSTSATGGISLHLPDRGRIILAADDLLPSEIVALDPKVVRGLVMLYGSARSHTAIFARTLGLPAVMGLGEALGPALDGLYAIVDGDRGELTVNPDRHTVRQSELRQQHADEHLQRQSRWRGLRTVTGSGRSIRLLANAGSLADVAQAAAAGAEGIGLFRSECLFLQSASCPDEEQQYSVYAQIMSMMPGRSVVIRTLDIGADKTAPYFSLPSEPNPAMGMRAVRWCFRHEDVFRTQLRALLRASAHGNLWIMIPMIISPAEVIRCRQILEEERCSLEAQQIRTGQQVRLGIMIETPAAALISDELAKVADFFSIGTNDLTQFVLACDRQNGAMGEYFDARHPAVEKLIAMSVENAHKAGIKVSICGDAAGDERCLSRFIDMGVDALSVVPGRVLDLREAVAGLDTPAAAEA